MQYGCHSHQVVILSHSMKTSVLPNDLPNLIMPITGTKMRCIPIVISNYAFITFYSVYVMVIHVIIFSYLSVLHV